MFARNLQTSHADLAGNVTNSGSGVNESSTIDQFQRLGEAALVALDGEANRQAAMIACINDFDLMIWMTLAVIPLTFVMRHPQVGPAGPNNSGKTSEYKSPVSLTDKPAANRRRCHGTTPRAR